MLTCMDKLADRHRMLAAEAASTPGLPTLDRRDARPLHRQLSDALRRQIAAGDLRSGDLLPSEHTLIARHGVSRGTVRQALATLRAEGLIGGSQGRPLAVRSADLTQPLGELISFSAWVRSLGKTPSGEVCEAGTRPSTTEEAAVLALNAGDAVFHLIRLRLADGVPLMIERTTFPVHIGDLLSGIDLDRDSIYAVLARRGIVFASARHLLGAIAASRTDARLLGIPLHAPLLRVRRHAVSPSGQPLEWSDDRYLGERVNFAVENTAIMPGVARRLQS